MIDPLPPLNVNSSSQIGLILITNIFNYDLNVKGANTRKETETKRQTLVMQIISEIIVIKVITKLLNSLSEIPTIDPYD